MTTDSPITAIVGGGIAGLSAAWSLQQAGHACVVLEAESRWGGMIDSERVQGFLVEGGPDSFLAAKPAAVELCRELGLEADLIATGPQPGGPRLLHLRQLLPLPPGWRLLAPTRLAPVLRSPLFSPAVKAALALRWPWSNTAPHDNETVAAYLERRFGRHVGRAFAATVVQPLLAGVYGGRADELSAALMAPPPPRPGAAPGGSVFLSLRHGMASLAERLADRLAPRLRPSCPVRALTASAKGFRLHCEGGAALDAHSVILAVPAWRAAQLLQDFDAGLAIPLSEIPYTSSVNVNLAYRTAPPLPPGHGFLAGDESGLLACTFAHQKFAHRAPAGGALLRLFYGAALAQANDAVIAAHARADLASTLGVADPPDFLRLRRCRRAMPQYTVGHRERMQRVSAALGQHPHLALAGNAYSGVGVPDCIASGVAAAAKIAAALGQNQTCYGTNN